MSETMKKTTTRCDLLGAAGFTALAGIAAVAIAKPDAQAVEVPPVAQVTEAPLLELCDRFMALQAQIDAICSRDDDHDDGLDALIDQQVPILDEMGDLSAASLEGQRARAQVLMAWYGGTKDLHAAAVEWERVAPLFHDLLGRLV